MPFHILWGAAVLQNENSCLEGPQIKSNFSTLSRGFASTLRVLTLPFHSFEIGTWGYLVDVLGLSMDPFSSIKIKKLQLNSKIWSVPTWNILCPFPYCEAQQDSNMDNSGLKGPQIETNLSIL